MKNITKILAAAAVAVALTQTVHATAITGTIGFSGTAQLDGSSVTSSSEVLAWGNNTVGITSGSFTGVSGSATFGAVPWAFTSGESSFWTVGGFTFNLTSTLVTTPVLLPSGYYSLTIFLAGTVTSSNPSFNATAFSGSLSVQDPSANNSGLFNYTESMSFTSVPDGGTTALLLGSALSGLALIRRKFMA